MKLRMLTHYKNLREQMSKNIINEKINKKFDNIIILTQYYKVKNVDINYQLKRQREIDYCLIKNCENEFVDKIHLLVETEYNLDFIPQHIRYKITQINIDARLSYSDAIKYYNIFIPNNYCVLLNSDIYVNNTIQMVKHIDFKNFKLFIALNRYEQNNFENTNEAITLNGLLEDAKLLNKVPYLDSYQESIWGQDGWIWYSDKMDIPQESNFHLGTNGCDNHIAYLFKNIGYTVINLSKFICITHVDLLSIIENEFGITKGNVSKNREQRIGNMDCYLFLENVTDFPDCYTNKMDYILDEKYSFKSGISFVKYTSPIGLNEMRITPSSSNVECISLFNNGVKNDYWSIPIFSEYIECSFSDFCDIAYMDIFCKMVSRFDKECGYVTQLKIDYLDYYHRWIRYPTLIDGINWKNANSIKRCYFDLPLKCLKIRIYILGFIGQNLFQFTLYKLNDNNKLKTINNNFTEINLYNGLKLTKLNGFQMIYFDNYWEDVTPTEKQVFLNFYKNKNLPHHYFAFPWSKFHDNKFKNDCFLSDIIDKMIVMNQSKPETELVSYFTVCLHESFVLYLDLFKLLGIKYIFSSQKTKDDQFVIIHNGVKTSYNLTEIENKYDVKIIPFSLHPYQNSENMELNPIHQRKYVTNFIGQYDKRYYISDIRQKIFDIFADFTDCYIRKRTSWHYETVVYGNAANADTQKEIEYKQLLNESIFSLCPSGSGANTIRFWECLSFGTIPILLADTLELPNIRDDWNKYIIIWEEDNIENLYDFLKNLNIDKIGEMSENCLALYNAYFCPVNMHRVIIEYFG
jgi:hypothetical protein